MSLPLCGTRTPVDFRSNHPPGGSFTESYTRDKGMSKLVSTSCTFSASPTSRITAANGTFTAFAVEDLIAVQGTNLNNGTYSITGIDATNHAYVTVDWPSKTEGPITAQIRAIF